LEFYNEAIKNDNENHFLYSNRSVTFLSLKNSKLSLEDADRVIELKPDWGKGYLRKGNALIQAERFNEAEDAFNKAIEVDPNNASQYKVKFFHIFINSHYNYHSLFCCFYSKIYILK